jgi:HEAT repeat protein
MPILMGLLSSLQSLRQKLTQPIPDLTYNDLDLTDPQVRQQALHAADCDCRSAACRAAEIIHDTQSIPELANALNDEDYEVRYAAAHALETFGDSATEALVWALQNGNTHARQQAAYVLGSVCDVHAREALTAALTEDNVPLVRLESALALGKLGALKAVPALITALDDTNVHVVRAAANALRDLGTPQALAAVQNHGLM